ncbi:titin-like [Gadus morhua]|uniref:titin-like n=1 Tax=Gadus morhua TaxID=8049 RepID=UPI0011B6A678|nr:titin-like [Gadus morhua]
MSLFYSAFSKVDEETYKTGLNLHHRTTAFQLKPEPTRSSLERKKEKPVFLSQLSPAAVTEGETTRFTVTVAGFPKPSVQWFHNGKGITASSTHTFTHEQDEYSLIINKVERTFEGEYSCTVCNRFGQSNWSSYLHVHLKDLVGYEKEVEKGDDPPNKPPDFSQKIEPLHSPQGGQALFRYKVTGSPLPEVQWLRGSYRIKPSQFCIIVNNSDGSGLMQIKSIKQEDSDIYTCKASNHFGEALCSAELEVFREAVQQEQRTVIQERGYKVTMTEKATESCLYPVSLLGQEISSSDQMVYTIGTEDRQVITSEQVGTIRDLNISATSLQREQVTHQAAVLQSHEVEERVSVAPAHPSYISAVPLKQLHMAAFTSSVLESQQFIEQHFNRILSPELVEVEFVKEQPSRLMSAIAQEVVPFTTVKPEVLPDNASEQLLTSSEPQQVVCGYQVQSALPIKETSALIVRQEEQKCFRVKEGMKILYTSNCAGQLPINERHVEPLVALESATEPLIDKERPEQVLAPVSETTLILAKENKFAMCRSEEESTIPWKDTVCWSAQCIEETYKIQAEYSGLNQGLESSLSLQSQREKERLLYLQVICDQDILQSEGRFLSEEPLSEQAIAGKNTALLYPVTQTEQKSLVCETTSGLSVITKSKRVQPKKEVPPTFFLHSVQDVTALPKEGFLSITKPEQQVAAQKQTKTRSHAATYEERREITADNHKDLDMSETGVKSKLGSEPRPLNILQVTSHPMELPKETPFPHDMKQERALVQREERWNLMNVTTLEDIQALVEAHTESLAAENTFTCQTAVEPKVPTEPVQVEKKEISTEISLSIEAAEQDVAVQIQEGQSVRQSIMMVEKHVLKGEFSHEIIKSESSKISVITQPELYLMAPQTEESTALPKELTFVIQIPKPSSVNIRRQLKDALQSAVAQEQPLLLADVVGKLEAAQIQEVRVQKEPKLAMFTYLVTSSGAAIEISLAFDGEYLQTADLRSELQAAFHSIVYQESQVLTLGPSTILLDSPQKLQAASALSKELLTSVVDSITVSERTRGWHSPVSHSASVKTEDGVTYNSVSVHECAEILELGLGPQQDEGASDLTTTVAKVSVEQHVHRETKEEYLSEAFMISGFSDSIVDYPIVMNPLDHECIEEHSHAVLSTTIKYVTKVNWLFNGKLVKSGKDFTCSKDNDTYTLIINKVIKEHQGEYICEAENEAGKTRTSSRLTVVSRGLKMRITLISPSHNNTTAVM